MLNIEENDIVFFVADKKKVAQTSLGALRVKLGHDLDLINKDAYEFLWVTDFPMFDYDEHEKFSWFMDAFQYGTPPHGGVGIGLERLTMILAGTDNIRDVVAFPKTASASDLMAQAPSPVDPAQLKELGIETK